MLFSKEGHRGKRVLEEKAARPSTKIPKGNGREAKDEKGPKAARPKMSKNAGPRGSTKTTTDKERKATRLTMKRLGDENQNRPRGQGATDRDARLKDKATHLFNTRDGIATNPPEGHVV